MMPRPQMTWFWRGYRDGQQGTEESAPHSGAGSFANSDEWNAAEGEWAQGFIAAQKDARLAARREVA